MELIFLSVPLSCPPTSVTVMMSFFLSFISWDRNDVFITNPGTEDHQ